MSFKDRKIFIIILGIILLGCLFGYFLAGFFAEKKEEIVTNEDIMSQIPYVDTLQTALNDAIQNKTTVNDNILADLLKRNEAMDYSLNTTINILGYPVCLLESYDGVEINAYTDVEKIKSILNNIPTNASYNENSFIQLYWMKQNGESIITWIALNEEDMSEVKTIGIITSQYQKLDDITFDIQKTKVSDFKDLSLKNEDLIEKYKPMVYQVQNKLLECKFTSNLMVNNEYKNKWIEYVIKSEDSYIFINTKDDSLYLIYENYLDTSTIPVIEQSLLDEKIVSGMTEEDFIKEFKEARLTEIYQFDEDTLYHSYVIRSSTDETTLIYYNFNNGIIELTDENLKSDNVPEKITETTETNS